jgi:hypothetical protein
MGSGWHRACHVQSLMAVVEQDRRLDELALVFAVQPTQIVTPRPGYAALARIGVIGKRQLGYVRVRCTSGIEDASAGTSATTWVGVAGPQAEARSKPTRKMKAVSRTRFSVWI